MIHVIVTMILKEGVLEEFIRTAREIAAEVRQEKGCIAYEYTVDIESPISSQEPLQKNRVTLIEKWESVEALRAHLSAPHMKKLGPRLQPLRESVAIRVTQSIG
ncbi:MAG TPA: putative quinol monooxygenase [Spirochaetia bacterium]|nr:putative quinol monooxygenase [Spirochaetia bacterium]